MTEHLAVFETRNGVEGVNLYGPEQETEHGATMRSGYWRPLTADEILIRATATKEVARLDALAGELARALAKHSTYRDGSKVKCRECGFTNPDHLPCEPYCNLGRLLARPEVRAYLTPEG